MGIGVLQPWHLIIILVVVLIIFGAGRLPEVGGALGKGIKDFKEAKDEPEGQEHVQEHAAEPVRPIQTTKTSSLDAARNPPRTEVIARAAGADATRAEDV